MLVCSWNRTKEHLEVNIWRSERLTVRKNFVPVICKNIWRIIKKIAFILCENMLVRSHLKDEIIHVYGKPLKVQESHTRRQYSCKLPLWRL